MFGRAAPLLLLLAAPAASAEETIWLRGRGDHVWIERDGEIQEPRDDRKGLTIVSTPALPSADRGDASGLRSGWNGAAVALPVGGYASQPPDGCGVGGYAELPLDPAWLDDDGWWLDEERFFRGHRHRHFGHHHDRHRHFGGHHHRGDGRFDRNPFFSGNRPRVYRSVGRPFGGDRHGGFEHRGGDRHGGFSDRGGFGRGGSFSRGRGR